MMAREMVEKVWGRGKVKFRVVVGVEDWFDVQRLEGVRSYRRRLSTRCQAS